jgi:hypothetical protein
MEFYKNFPEEKFKAIITSVDAQFVRLPCPSSCARVAFILCKRCAFQPSALPSMFDFIWFYVFCFSLQIDGDHGLLVLVTGMMTMSPTGMRSHSKLVSPALYISSRCFYSRIRDTLSLFQHPKCNQSRCALLCNHLSWPNMLGVTWSPTTSRACSTTT